MRVTKYSSILNEDKVCILKKESSVNYKKCKSIKESIDVVYLFNNLYDLQNQTEEILYLICTNTKNKVSGIFEVSRGTVFSTFVSPREVMKKALLCNSTSIIIVHNHPSGDPLPSTDDLKTTKLLIDCSKLMGIRFLDHIIIGDSDSYFSMKGNDLIKDDEE